MKVNKTQLRKIKASAAIQLAAYPDKVSVSSVEKAFVYTGENWVTAWVSVNGATDLKEVRVRLS